MLLLCLLSLRLDAGPGSQWTDQMRAARELHFRGEFAAAARIYDNLAHVAVQNGRSDLQGVALYGLGASLAEQGRNAEAESTYHRALAAIRKSAVDATAVEVRVLNGLAPLYLSEERDREAETTLARLAALPLERFPEDAAMYGINRARLLTHRRKLRESGEVLRRALAAAEASLGESSPFTAGLVMGLGHWAEKSGSPADAVRYFERAFALVSAQRGEWHISTARALINLSRASIKAGEFERAEQLAARALPIVERQFGPEHALTAAALLNRADALRKLNRAREARPLRRRGESILANLPRSPLGAVIDVSALRDQGLQ